MNATELQIPPALLTPEERTAVITRLNRVMNNTQAFLTRGYSPLAVTAYPWPTATGLSANVVVVIDRPTEFYADLIKPEHELQEEAVSKRIRMQFMTIAQAAHGWLEPGGNVLGERLLVDLRLDRAAGFLAREARVSAPYLAAYQQVRNFYGVALQRQGQNGLSPDSVHEVALAAAVRLSLEEGGRGIGAEELVAGAKRAMGRLREEPDLRSLWGAAQKSMHFEGGMLSAPHMSAGFRRARLDVLAQIGPFQMLDARAAASAELLSDGGTRGIFPTVRNELVASLSEAPDHGAQTELDLDAEEMFQ